MKIDFTKRFNSILKNKDITQSKLSKITGITQSSISDWSRGKYLPKQDKVDILAKALGVSPAYLMGWENKEDLKPKPQSEQTIQVPLVGYIAAGTPILAEENIEDYYNIDKRIKADFCLKVKGDSMIGSHILDGDIAFIKAQPTLENGEIGAVLVSGNTATLKKVYVNKDNVILQPSNVNYQPIIISGQDLTEFRILGKLVANLSPKDL